MDKYLFFSGDKPTLEDETFSRDALIQAILDRANDLFTDGIVQGFAVSQDGSDLVLAPGVAYLGGERIVSSAEVRQAWPAGQQYVFVGYTLTEGAPKTHYVTGLTHQTRQAHGFALRLASSATPGARDLLVARVQANGTVEDLRSFAQVVSDPRMHPPGTDTHTTAQAFRVGYQDAMNPGSAVLTVLNALEQHPELALLFRSGIINLQDGHGDRVIETRKVPSKPGTPVLVEANLALQIHADSPDHMAALTSALDVYTAARVSVEALSTQVSELDGYRALINAKRLLGYTLGQIRGTENVGGSADLDVWHAKQQAIVTGTAGVSREPGTLAITSGSANVTGAGTDFSSSLEGEALLLHSDGLLLEAVVLSVNVGLQTLVLTEAVGVSEGAAYFYLAKPVSLGYGADVATASEMLAAVDAVKASRAATRTEVLQTKAVHANTVLELFTEEHGGAEDSYALRLSWDKPALVDQEEIRGYRVRVYELKHTRTRLPVGVAKDVLESIHVDLIHRSHESATIPRQKREAVQASDLTASGSTTTLVKVAGTAVFQPGTRVEVGGVSRIVKAYNSSSRTIELLTALVSAPGAGVALTGYQLSWEGDVWTERLQWPIRGGQHLVLFAQAVTEYDVGGDWSAGLEVLTGELQSADGQTLAEILARRRSQERTRFEVERDRLATDLEEQVFTLQRALAEAPTQEQFSTVVKTIEELQAGV
ncbi:MAG: hypothetical protein Q8O14_14475 [bacterium]|nr:hypothetical protein [bacterium]